jgi:adenosine deaminase
VTINSDDPAMVNSGLMHECELLCDRRGPIIDGLERGCLTNLHSSLLGMEEKVSLETAFIHDSI